MGEKEKENKKDALKIAYCDDDKTSLNAIAGAVMSILQQQEIPAQAEKYISPLELLDCCQRMQLDLVFLDIEMPGLDGIELGQKLREVTAATEIIYVSHREDCVFNALQVHPFGFVRKSHFLKDIEDVMRSYLTMLDKRRTEKNVVVQTQSGYLRVPISRVLYFEGGGTYQHMFVADRAEPVRVTSRMQKLEEELTPHGFLRVHKGYLVNFDAIDRFSGDELLLTNGISVPISRSKAREVKEKYLQLSRENGVMLF